MNLYLITQDDNDGYDTHDAAVVAAPTAAIARRIHPGSGTWGDTYTTWASSPDKVKAQLIGVAAKGVKSGEVFLASFNAG